MRVLLIGPYPPPHGGVQTHLVAIRQFLRKRAVPCAVVNITRHRKTEVEEIYYPKNTVELIWRLLSLPHDVIHLHFGGNLSPRLLALSVVCCLIPRTKTVMTFHSGGYPTSEAGRRASWWTLRGFVLRRFDRVIGVNPELVKMFERFGVPPERARFIPPHAESDAAVADPEASWPEDLRAFFTAHSPVLLTVGGFEPEYAIPAQIEMLGALRRSSPNAGLIAIGGGSQEQHIRGLAKATPYASHVLLCGDVPHAVTLGAIARSDLLLLGTPVLATDNGMRPAGVYLMSDSSPEPFSARVQECLRRPQSASPRQVKGDERNLEAILQLYFELRPDLEQRLSSSAAMAD